MSDFLPLMLTSFFSPIHSDARVCLCKLNLCAEQSEGKGDQKDYGLITTLAEKQIKVTLDGFGEEDVKWKSTVSYTRPLLALFLQRH